VSEGPGNPLRLGVDGLRGLALRLRRPSGSGVAPLRRRLRSAARPWRRLLARAGPAVVTATGITLVVSGLATFDATAGSLLVPTPRPAATPAPQGSPTPLPTIPFATPMPTQVATGTASRVVIPAMGIDLPVVRENRGFPWCNVALYKRELSQPGRPGTTYISAHARVETFLRLLELSQVRDGAPMLGMLVQVYTSDGGLFLYEIDAVRRHVVYRGFAALPPGRGEVQDLILQTSEGDRYTQPKVQVHARFLYSQRIDPAEANPVPRPVVCY
jgi:hypothetical protein